ncbi:PDR/VanB family oxidoreductase [Actinomycetospora cinnamomea]|uniref:Vanillate demethylase subunit B n=1 Tax=Actinomycetospora cinnamomea TaxID=663609 RepID=A0A2U1EC79_9PSEU|nr:PDR/VanB family oxidoreductase [Actinomycetospora cinnamomea]PVY97497.1 vanillate demethylase subunit B [Actinomycetospora cinnamomea]
MSGAGTFVPATVRAVRAVADEVRQVELVPDDGARPYPPGSHLDLALEVDGLPVVRSYSVVGAAPDDGAYRIAVKLLPESRGGSRRVHGLAAGDRLELRHPTSHFELDPRRPGYLLVAGGIGITPLVGMAEVLARRHPHQAPVRLAYAGRRRAAMPFVEHLRALLGDDAVVTAAGEDGERLDLAAEVAALHADGEAYLCGPPRLTDAVRACWEAQGRPPRRLRTETFGTAGRHPTEPFDVEVRDHGLTVHVPRDRTLLGALHDAGVGMVWDCLRGECGLCTVRVLGRSTDGQPVVDHRDVFLDAAEREDSTRLCACVSRAVGGRLAIDTGYRP